MNILQSIVTKNVKRKYQVFITHCNHQIQEVSLFVMSYLLFICIINADYVIRKSNIAARLSDMTMLFEKHRRKGSRKPHQKRYKVPFD